ncbi:hypothetical protein OSB04_025330 [Centaurea solstitialis]|uniref:Uncharacterized protein n=1 Tax=Centaurea solstitialis TaxID=347529 RepID=A0AA38SNI0_9ASTR|nr:hypothetical protein OSB04_025330 [Centaurea solstitialis]
MEGESLPDTYSRFNTLISNCKRYGVIRSPEDNNSLFLGSLDFDYHKFNDYKRKPQSDLNRLKPDVQLFSIAGIKNNLEAPIF